MGSMTVLRVAVVLALAILTGALLGVLLIYATYYRRTGGMRLGPVHFAVVLGSGQYLTWGIALTWALLEALGRPPTFASGIRLWLFGAGAILGMACMVVLARFMLQSGAARRAAMAGTLSAVTAERSWWRAARDWFRPATHAQAAQMLSELIELRGTMSNVAPLVNDLAARLRDFGAGPLTDLINENANLKAQLAASREADDLEASQETPAVQNAVNAFNEVAALVTSSPDTDEEVPEVTDPGTAPAGEGDPEQPQG